MDPTTALDRIRGLFALLQARGMLTEDELDELSQTFDGLDEWLSKGGFLPRPWQRKPGAK